MAYLPCRFGSNVVYLSLCDDGTCRVAFPHGKERCPFVTHHAGANVFYCKRFRMELRLTPCYGSPDVADGVLFKRCDQCKEGLRKLEVLAKVPRESRRKK